jgi:hypothetical protein
MTSCHQASCLAVAGLLSVAALAEGQQPGPAPTPHRTQRVLAVGNVVFIGQWKPLATVGGLWQLSLTRTRVGRDEFGAARITPPRWYVHTLLAGGASFDPPDSEHDVTATAHAQLGVVRRNDSALTAWGPVLHFSSSPRSFGGAFRVEVMDNLGIELGLAHLNQVDRNRLMISIDYFKKLCQDLGFGHAC